MKEKENETVYELTITSESVVSTNDEFSMDDLTLGDGYRPIDTYFTNSNGDVVRRNYIKNEKKNTNQTLPKLAFQIFAEDIKNLSADEKREFPVCQYTPSTQMFMGIFANIEEFRKYRNTIEYLTYYCDDGEQLVIYCWNIFSPIIFVQECLKRFGNKGDKFTLIYRKKTENEKMQISDEEETKNQVNDKGYWFLNANPKLWSMSSMPVGEVQDYTLFNDNGNKRRIYQNFLNAKVGDMVIGYESTPVKQIVAIMQINAEQDGDRIYFKKLEGLSSPIDYATLKSSPELEDMEYFGMQQGSLFKLTKDEYDYILDMIREQNPVLIAKGQDKYDRIKFLNEVFMKDTQYDTLVSLMKHKKNIILQGAPGVGKTFSARRLAYSIMGEKDDERIEFIQFHQNYSYEDFIMGYKPDGDGFQLKDGIFYRFCQKAANSPDKVFFFIIDEINRGNMSKIFGELLMLIEKDYRGKKLTLAYNGLPFYVPENLYIIGMMNTADRSLAMIDYALRRRFSFFEIEPGFDSDGFSKYQNQFENETFNKLIETIKALNTSIENDNSLGKGFKIGHSYFCGQSDCTKQWMQEVVDYDIIPMLNEYWFDEPARLNEWENKLRGVLND